MSEACRNCGARLDGAFCSACGQAAFSRLTFAALWRDSLARFLDLDGGFLHTLVALTLRPGESIRQYVDGRRRPLTPPVGYCFLLVTLYALTINLLDVEVTVGELGGFNETEQRVYHIIHGLLAYLVFLAIWPAALIQRRLFRSSGLTLAETYVCGLYVFGHVNLAATLFAAAGLLAKPAGLLGLLTIQLAYMVWTIGGFYRLPRPPVLRGTVISVTGFLATNLLSLIVGNLIVAAGLLEQLESFLA